MPVASAILTTIGFGRYTIIDVSALKSLGIGNSFIHSIDSYLSYLCKYRQLAQQYSQLAQQYNKSLRTVDHALRQWGMSLAIVREAIARLRRAHSDQDGDLQNPVA